jgi:hypothetical protein
MASTPPQDSQSGGSLTNAIKGMFPALGGASKTTVPAPIKTKAPHEPHGRVAGQDSLPELVGTPSEIGIWEQSAHDLKSDSGRFQWQRLFQDPRMYRKDLQPASPAASPKK